MNKETSQSDEEAKRSFRILCGSEFLIGWIISMWSLLFPLFLLSKKLETVELGGAFGASDIMFLLITLVTGTISDRLGRRKIILLSFGLSTVTLPLYLFATEYWHIIAIQLARGAFSAIAQSAYGAMQVDVAAKGKIGERLGMLNTARNVALFGGSILIGYVFLIEAQIGFWIVFLLEAFRTSYYVFLLPESVAVSSSKSQKKWWKLLRPSFDFHIKKNLGVIFALILLMNSFSTTFMVIALIDYTTNVFLASSFVLGILFSSFYLVSAVASYQGGKISGKNYAVKFARVCAVLAALFIFIQPLATTFSLFIVLVLVYLVFADFEITIRYILMAKSYRQECRGLDYSIYAMVETLSGIIGIMIVWPLLTLIKSSGLMAPFWWFGSMAYLIGSLIIYQLYKVENEEAVPSEEQPAGVQ